MNGSSKEPSADLQLAVGYMEERKGMVHDNYVTDNRNRMRSFINEYIEGRKRLPREVAGLFLCTVTCWLEFSPAVVLVA